MRFFSLLQFVLLPILAVSCSAPRTYTPNPQEIIVVVDHPGVYAVKADGMAGIGIGRLDARAGDTIRSFGKLTGAFLSYRYYRVLRNDTLVYILDSDALTGDEYLYNQLGRTFQLDIVQHAVAWARAGEYLAGTQGGVGFASDSVLTTKADEDYSGVIYRITCRRAEHLMEYEIFCSQHYELSDTVRAAGNLAFYMATGRRYEP